MSDFESAGDTENAEIEWRRAINILNRFEAMRNISPKTPRDIFVDKLKAAVKLDSASSGGAGSSSSPPSVPDKGAREHGLER